MARSTSAGGPSPPPSRASRTRVTPVEGRGPGPDRTHTGLTRRLRREAGTEAAARERAAVGAGGVRSAGPSFLGRATAGSGRVSGRVTRNQVLPAAPPTAGG